jgi:hypothetical protein
MVDSHKVNSISRNGEPEDKKKMNERQKHTEQSGILYNQIKLLGVEWKTKVNATIVVATISNFVQC